MRGRAVRSNVVLSLLLSGLLIWPLIPSVPYDLLNSAILACTYLVVALSLVFLIGLVGQISLSQAALVGMGAFVSALATLKFNIRFPYTLGVGMIAGALTALLIGVVAVRVRGLYLAVATLIFAYVCDQYLFAQPWLVESHSGTSIPAQAIGKVGSIPYFDLADAHVFYYVALAVAAFMLYTVANLRDSRVGRALAAIRGSEVAAASLGIPVTRFKLLAFALAGGMAGLGGAMTMVGQRTVAPGQFNFITSLTFLTIAVVGGLRSIGGAIASSLLFALLVGEVFYRVPWLADYLDLISAGLLILVLLFFRGGLGALPGRLRVLAAWAEPWWSRLRPALGKLQLSRRASPGTDPAPIALAETAVDSAELVLEPEVEDRPGRWPLLRRGRAEPASRARHSAISGLGAIDVMEILRRFAPVLEKPPARILPLPPQPRPEPENVTEALISAARADSRAAGEMAEDGRRQPILMAADNITVRFGGLTAVDDVSIRVGAGEIVGLIGPNGAGKTTLFNSILGLNKPTTGRVRLFDRDVTDWDVHRRAALGVGRTFQILQLFNELTVFDNLLVATHLQTRVGPFGSIFVTPGARRGELMTQARVNAVLKLMGLVDIADRRVAGLPFGTLRRIEVARTLVTEAPLVCFDEPASGLDSAETEQLIEWFGFLREVGVTVLVIEHDVSMVVRLCDHIYVLDQGRLIASGTPSDVQADPQVIASYLGTAFEAAS